MICACLAIFLHDAMFSISNILFQGSCSLLAWQRYTAGFEGAFGGLETGDGGGYNSYDQSAPGGGYNNYQQNTEYSQPPFSQQGMYE